MNPNPNDKQQGAARKGDSQQQQQTRSGEGQEYGEGNYKATRQYNEGLKEHVQEHDIEREAPRPTATGLMPKPRSRLA